MRSCSVPVVVLVLVVAGLASACATRAVAEPVTVGHHVRAARAERIVASPATGKAGDRGESFEIDPAHGLAEIARVPRGQVIVHSISCGFTVLEPLHFLPQSVQLDASRMVTVDELAKTIVRLQSEQTLELAVVGHADLAEHDADRVALARARTVAAALHARGVRALVEVYGVGATQPRTRERQIDRAVNRRVDFMIVRRGEKS